MHLACGLCYLFAFATKKKEKKKKKSGLPYVQEWSSTLGPRVKNKLKCEGVRLCGLHNGINEVLGFLFFLPILLSSLLIEAENSVFCPGSPSESNFLFLRVMRANKAGCSLSLSHRLTV